MPAGGAQLVGSASGGGAGEVAQLGRFQHRGSRVARTMGAAGDENAGTDGRPGLDGDRGREDGDEHRHVVAGTEYGGRAVME